MPRRKVVLSPRAARDLDAVRQWYSQPGAGAKAKARVRAILKTIRELRQDPVRWPEGDEPGTREVVAEGHVIVYRVDPDTGLRRTAGDVRVARIFGPGQNRW